MECPRAHITPFVFCLVALCVLCACDRHPSTGRVLEQNSLYTVTTDSVTQGDWQAWADADGILHSNVTAALLDSALAGPDSLRFGQGTTWQAGHALPDGIGYHSPHPLPDALFAMSAEMLAAHRRNDRIDIGSTDTTHALHAVGLSLALVEPQRCMGLLRDCVDETGTIRSFSGEWPVHTHRLLWVNAAWEVYLSTGDKKWLRWVRETTARTLVQDRQLIHHPTGLLQGAVPGTDGQWPYAPWMLPADKFATMSLANNVYFTRALDILDEMNNELGIESPGSDDAARQADAINQLLWDEGRGCYSAMRYGTVYKMLSPIADNLSQALAVLWNIASDDRAATLIEKTPVTHRGIYNYYPSLSQTEPCFDSPLWPVAQACWTMAAAAVGNRHAVSSGMAALTRAQAFFASRHIRPVSQPDNDWLMATAGLAMTLRVMLGMRLTTDGIEFNPMVPDCYTGSKTLSHLRYRNAQLEITVNGTGSEVMSMTIDGEKVEGGFVPASLQGNHTIAINLARGRIQSQHITLARAHTQLPGIPQVAWDPDSGHIEDFGNALAYKMVINGVRTYSVSDSSFSLPPTGDFAEIAITAANKFGYSFCTPPRLLIKGESHTLSATDGNVCVVDTVDGSLNLHLHVRQGGAYLLDVSYKIHGGCDLRAVLANTHPAGMLVLPAARVPSAFLTSNVVEVELLRGDNIVVIMQPQGLPVTGRASLQHIRIYKNNQKYRL